MESEESAQASVVLSEEERASLVEGLDLAEKDSRRWTPAEVTEDAKLLTAKWRKSLEDQASA